MAIRANVGDVVHVRGVVKSVGPATVMIEFDHHLPAPMDSCLVGLQEIVHVEPQPLKVGDRVRSRDGASICGPIIGIDKAHAWVKPVSAGFGFIVELDRLDRADEPRPLKVGDKVRHKESGRTSHVTGFWQNVHGVPMVLVLNVDGGKEDSFPIQFMERVE